MGRANLAQTIWVKVASESYPIYLGKNVLTEAFFSPLLKTRQVFIISNETVAPLYLDQLITTLKAYDVSCHVLPDGEQFKTVEAILQITAMMIKTKQNRDTCIIALGGGVVCDMAGLSANLYQRGVAVIQVPTTLLSQVDASVGGKTGVNFSGEKNVLGTFYQPKAVLIDILLLKSLASREYKSGLAEVIKYALLGSYEFFVWLEANMTSLVLLKEEALVHAISLCCRMKAEIVARDEQEKGERALLNLGHTFAHALESLTDFKQFLHGEAVAIGLHCAAILSLKLGYLAQETVSRVRALIEASGLPVTLAIGIDINAMYQLLIRDKKVREGVCRFIVLREIGQAAIETVADKALVLSVLDEVRVQG